ncbi:MAG: TolC family protein [Nitrospirae bacterium CG_4_10_14_0_8_um_filter_41_23]|nr:MAG: TolC family protein [Nitrospirae bacterium CG_4_10_14_0_8_um_filter_41_23]
MKHFIPIIVVLLLIMPFKVRAEEIIKKGESLNLERCVEIALKIHPNIIAAKNTINANESRIGQSKANYYPQIDWTSSASRTSVGTRTSFGLKTSSVIFNSYSTSAALNQNIYDFGKTAAQVKIQRLNYDSSLSDVENTSEQIILNVKQTYYGVLQAKRSRDVSAETVKQFEQHLEQAKGFYEVGTKPKFDVTKAEVDLSNSKLNMIRAENAVRIAVASLNNAMGVPDAPGYEVEDNLSFKKYEMKFDDAVSKAYQNRPDLKSIIVKKQVAESSVELAKKGYFPVLTGTAGYDYAGNTFPLERGWNIGATFSFPVFNGFLTKYQVEEAKENLNVLRANEESLRQSVFLEVQQAYLNLKEAEDSIPTAELTVQQAQENFEIANGRYAAGVGNPIEVTDAEVLLSNAKLSYIQALYNYKVSQASLEKAMGIR